MLYGSRFHEPLTDRGWAAAWVRDAIAALTRDAVAAYDPEALWPQDDADPWAADLPLKNVYDGGAGVVWALARLGAEFDAARAAMNVLEQWRARPATFGGDPVPAQARSSLLGGETGIAFVAYALAPSRELDALLLELVRANLGNEADELMWGVPGTLLVARAMHARTAGQRWADAVGESEADLRGRRDADGWWTQRLYGHEFRSLGPVHGLVGNVLALGEPGRAPELLRKTALHENGHVNWPPALGDAKLRLQWCHGAPGIITTAAALLDVDLLLGGAQLTWDAGPLDRIEKGASLCHGTAGNGYALLATYERTGDELWLQRARAFAVHALEQARDLPPRYSLLTGGVGVALFAQDCLDARARFPILEDLGTSVPLAV